MKRWLPLPHGESIDALLSDGQDILRLLIDHLVNLLDLLIRFLLKIVLKIRDLVLRDLILQLFEWLIRCKTLASGTVTFPTWETGTADP